MVAPLGILHRTDRTLRQSPYHNKSVTLVKLVFHLMRDEQLSPLSVTVDVLLDVLEH